MMNHLTISCSSMCILFWLPLRSWCLSASAQRPFPDYGRSDTVSMVSLSFGLVSSAFLVPNALLSTQQTMTKRAMTETIGITIALTMVSVSVDEDDAVEEADELLWEEDPAGQMPVILHDVWLVVQAEQELQAAFTRQYPLLQSLQTERLEQAKQEASHFTQLPPESMKYPVLQTVQPTVSRQVLQFPPHETHWLPTRQQLVMQLEQVDPSLHPAQRVPHFLQVLLVKQKPSQQLLQVLPLLQVSQTERQAEQVPLLGQKPEAQAVQLEAEVQETQWVVQKEQVLFSRKQVYLQAEQVEPLQVWQFESQAAKASTKRSPRTINCLVMEDKIIITLAKTTHI